MFNLPYEIILSECSYKISSSKVEIKLKKKENVWWKTLENDGLADDGIKQGKCSVQILN